MASPLTGAYQLGISMPDPGSPLVVGHDSPVPEVSLLTVHGLGPSVQTSRAKLSLADGVAVGVDTNGSRVVKLGVEVWCIGDDEAAGEWWLALSTAFDAVKDPNEVRNLWLWFPGIGHRELTGRPLGASDDGLVSLAYGLIEMTLEFEVTTGDLGTIVEEP